MKSILFGLAILALAPVAQAQVIIQVPPGGRVMEPPYRADYWRGERGHGWDRREAYREEYRRQEWRRAHCVRDYRNQEFCRR